MEKLQVIAKEPHPIQTPEHDKVRDYLLSELEGLGLKHEIQKAFVSNVWNGDRILGYIDNIITRIPGTDNSKAVMIEAHYDSVSTGPGAGDDGAAIAAMLETVRALQVSGPLKNDVILLMTDGEEVGMLERKRLQKKIHGLKTLDSCLILKRAGTKVRR